LLKCDLGFHLSLHHALVAEFLVVLPVVGHPDALLQRKSRNACQ
jgi:hypothetical protein